MPPCPSSIGVPSSLLRTWLCSKQRSDETAEGDSVAGAIAFRSAQTEQYALSSANSVPHTEQARLAGVAATVSSSPVGFYSIWTAALEKNRPAKPQRARHI
jgi:hypothetical protein